MDRNPKKSLMSRKRFLKLSALLLSIYPIKLFFDLLNDSRSAQMNELQQILPMDLPEGITFHDDVIANKSGENVRFYSAVCPHLGCGINRLDEGHLICPCHGSRFSPDGKPVEGPATGSLPELRHTADINGRRYTVYLPI
ncbi:MAG: Rieske (2Fe-2S) protein [Proteobacteria bacterium]|nr:Rieske (2Fe-2S) protein [Pseudomonadota bacterium]